MLNDFINKIGTDKLLHFAFGALITYTLSNVFMLQDGLSYAAVIGYTIAAIIITMLLELFKEKFLDAAIDKKDIIATLIGALIPLVVNGIGILFNYLSN